MTWIFYLVLGSLLGLTLLAGRRRALVQWQLYTIVIVLALVAGLRYGDFDYVNYAEIFADVPAFSELSLDAISGIHGEWGFLALVSLAKGFGIGFTGFLLLLAFATVALVAFSTYRLSYVPLASMVFYFSHVFLLREMMQIRAALAVAVVLFAFSLSPGMLKRSAVIAMAALFHAGAAIILPFYWLLSKKEFAWRTFVILLVFGLLISVVGLGKPITHFLAAQGVLPAAVETYIGWDEYNGRLSTLGNPVLWKAVLILYLLRRTPNEELGEAVGVLRNLYAAGVLLFLCLSDFAILAGRLSTFLFLGEAILVSWAFFYRRTNLRWGMIFGVIVLAQLSMDILVTGVHQDIRFGVYD
jgi:hypothetical protein